MPVEIYLVKTGMTMTEGMVAEWYVGDGARVEKGDLLYALETEKINMDVDAEASGIVRHLVSPGINMAPGEVVGFIFADGEKIPDDITALQAMPADRGSVTLNGNAVPAASPPSPSPPKRQRVAVSPAARRLARELKVDIASLSGTGPGGRIVEADVRAAAGAKPESAPPKASPAARRRARERGIDIAAVKGSGPSGRVVKQDIDLAGADRIPMTGMRRTIARRMQASLAESAQLTMHMEVDMDEAVKMREQLVHEWRAESIRPGYTDLVVRATVKALAVHPRMNSQFSDEEIRLHADIHLGIAVSLDDGLVVPVIRNAGSLTLKEIAVESSSLAEKARNGSLGMDDFAGGTFTVTALGMHGVDAFTPIINAPQAGILGVNRIFDAVAWDGDRPVPVRRMNLSLTWDHRILDGVPAAGFLAEVKALLEAPYRLLV